MEVSQLRVANFAKINSENNAGLEDFSTRIKSEQKDGRGEDIYYRPPSSKRRQLDQDRSPEQDIERKFFGPYGKVDNEINVRFSSSDGRGNTEEDLMIKLGLPTRFAADSGDVTPNYVEDTIRERGKRGEKKTYYCEICMIELNSCDTMNSHIRGVKHMKKKIASSQQMNEATEAGQPVPETLPTVIQISNPEPLKKKVPIRLEKKLKETLDPIVGLKFVKEYRAVSDIEMEPHYECTLCDKQGQANGMFAHIMGSEHRKNFVNIKFVGDQNYMDLNQKELLQVASDHRENGLSFSDLMITHNSDELYPWPAGKAPWSFEQGGTGIAPDNARENYGKSKAEKYDGYCNPSHEMKKERNSSPNGYIFSDLPIPQSLKRPRSVKEVSRYLESGTDMLKKVLEFDGIFNSKEVKVIKANLTAIMTSAAIEIAEK